jgi:hypothetical protein
MLPAHAESRATTAGKWLLVLVTPASALALGSVPPEVLVFMSFLAAIACALLWIDRDVQTSRASRWVLIALLVLLGMTVLQAMPLPGGVGRVLTPGNADIWDRALSPLREPGPAWHPLSVAPPATRIELLRGFFYGCIFLAALRVATLEHGERFLVRLIVFSTVLMALSALAHAAVSAERVFGVYRPRESYAYVAGRLAPLLNANHLSAYLNVGACVALGSLLARRAMPRALSGSAAVVLAATSMWHGSRGATGALLFGIVLTFVLTFYTRRSFQGARAAYAILAACAIAAAVIVSISLSDRSSHLLSHDFAKVAVAHRSLGLIASSPWFGIGRGGFETVFSSVHEGSFYETFTNPEDIVIQWFVEWGVPVSLAGAALLGWALRPQLVLGAVRPAIGVWVATVAVFLHDLVDFHLEIPGIVVLVAVCVAIVVSGRAKSRQSQELKSSSSARLAAIALPMGTILAIASVWPQLGHTLAEERKALSAMAVDKSMPREQFRDEVRAAMLRYPAEPFVPLMGAVRAQVNGEGSVVPWIGRALERNPRFGRAHLVLARSLRSTHAAQARLEYRLAYENEDDLRRSVLTEVGPLVEDASSALEVVPEGPIGAEVLEGLVTSIASRLPSTAVILDEEIERRSPGALEPMRRRAEAVVSDATSGAPWCSDGKGCMQDATAAADELVRRDPTMCRSHLVLARLRIARGEASAALDGLERAMEPIADRLVCERQLITLALQNGQAHRADVALDRVLRSGCGAAADCVGLYGWAASTEEGRGHYVRAVRLYRRLLEVVPDNDEVLEHIGALGVHDGVRAEALDAYGILATRHPSDARWPARIAELRARAGPPPIRAP